MAEPAYSMGFDVNRAIQGPKTFKAHPIPVPCGTFCHFHLVLSQQCDVQ